MKTVFIRMLALISLATSLSAACAAETKTNHNAVNSSAAARQNGCPAAEEGKKQKNEKKGRSGSAEGQEFDRVLMGIYG